MCFFWAAPRTLEEQQAATRRHKTLGTGFALHDKVGRAFRWAVVSGPPGWTGRDHGSSARSQDLGVQKEGVVKRLMMLILTSILISVDLGPGP